MPNLMFTVQGLGGPPPPEWAAERGRSLAALAGYAPRPGAPAVITQAADGTDLYRVEVPFDFA
ncbi:hypothetical protein [Streptomyces sp. DT18]